MAYKVNHGNYGATKLDGAKFWIAGDLGGDFSKGEMDWAILTFDPTVTAEAARRHQNNFATRVSGEVEVVLSGDGRASELERDARSRRRKIGGWQIG